MALALEGIKVVEAAQVAAVPMAGRFLADWGADVIHIENPATGDYWRGLPSRQVTAIIPSTIDYIWENFNRNKRSLTLDLSQEGGQQIIYRLVEKADVFLTNFRPRELEKFKVDYGTLSELNPGLVYASLTGYGKKGPERDAPGYDRTAYWPRSGRPHAISEPGTPPPPAPETLGDGEAGLALACGVMTALFVRERTGIGQEVDVSLFQTGVFAMSFDISGALVTGQDKQATERSNVINPLVMMYQTGDRRWLQLWIVQPERYWSRFCQAIDRQDLERDPRFDSFDTMMKNRVALFNILEEVFLGKTLSEWRICLNDCGLPWGPVQNLPEVVNDSQARANEFFFPFDHPTYGRMKVVANPINLSKTPATIRLPAPQFGQHTEEILLEYGYTWEDIERFKQQRAVA